jgi:hypothetical protein
MAKAKSTEDELRGWLEEARITGEASNKAVKLNKHARDTVVRQLITKREMLEAQVSEIDIYIEALGYADMDDGWKDVLV